MTDAVLKSPAPLTPRAVAFRPSGLRVVSAPTIVQMDAVECGAACLVSILAFHGRHIAIEEARRVCGVSRDGSSALQLTAAASNYGLKCEGYGVDSAELRDLQLPGILYWGFDHFVVLEGWSRGRWRIMDPSIGHRWVSAAEFDEKFTGVVLELSPTADFRRGGRTRGVRQALVERMRGSWRVVAATAACGVLLAVPAFTLPALGAVYVDRVLLEGATGWLLPMVLLALAAMVVSAVLAYVQQQLLAKLASGLYLPWSGEVLIDGRPLASIPRHERATAIAVVGQTPILFAASLRDNLSMWDPLIPDAWMREATDDAGLAGLIEARGGLGMMIAEGGINLSGGEAQRVEIARALSRRPSILILDEATSSLDATTESQIDRALRRRGCACLVIAHRLSTIRDADEIVVLDRGTIVERGSHDELMALNGAYVAFVRGGGQG